MLIISIFALLFVNFFFFRKPFGAAGLASAAGLLLYSYLKTPLTDQLLKFSSSFPRGLIEIIIFLVLVIALPLFLYFFSNRNKLNGIGKILEALVFASFLTSVSIWCITYFLPADPLSNQIIHFITEFKPVIISINVIFAYFSLLFHRNPDKY